MKDTTQEGNPAIGMSADSIDSADVGSGSSGEDFFTALENQVNGAISDDLGFEETSQEASPNTGQNGLENSSPKVSSEPRSNADDELGQMKKRYSDSSREAQKMKAQLDELKPFIPVLNAMKEDSGLVEHMKGYLENGGNVPTNVKDELKLDDDFEFDVDDMVTDPNSDSAKVFHSMVNKVVDKKANSILAQEEVKAQEMRTNIEYHNEAKKFMEERGMKEDEFLAFVDEAKGKISGKLSLDDMYHLVNRDKVNQNVAANTKQDMLKQMKGVRNMPTSQAGINNAGEEKKTTSDKMFEALMDFDSGVDNMFG